MGTGQVAVLGGAVVAALVAAIVAVLAAVGAFGSKKVTLWNSIDC